MWNLIKYLNWTFRIGTIKFGKESYYNFIRVVNFRQNGFNNLKARIL